MTLTNETSRTTSLAMLPPFQCSVWTRQVRAWRRRVCLVGATSTHRRRRVSFGMRHACVRLVDEFADGERTCLRLAGWGATLWSRPYPRCAQCDSLVIADSERDDYVNLVRLICTVCLMADTVEPAGLPADWHP